MDRLFQDCEGEIKELANLKAEKLLVLVDRLSLESEENVMLLWLKTQKSWLRIFIDCGCYCGIDEFDEDLSQDDADEDDDILKTQDEWVRDKIIKKVFVKCDEKYLINLFILFIDGSIIVLKCDEDERCELSYKKGKYHG